MSNDQVSWVTEVLSGTITSLQLSIAVVLAVVLVVGVVNLAATLWQAIGAFDVYGYKSAIELIDTTVDIVLYLFIVIELWRTIIAYIGSESVVRAVIHAGLIAIVRQIITFKPGQMGSTEGALMTATAYLILLVGLLLGYYIVHEEEMREPE